MPTNDDLFDLLIADHRRVQHQLETLIAACRNEERVDFSSVEQLCTELDLHMRLEETHLYPNAEKESDIQPQIRESRHEHQQVKDLLQRIKTHPSPDELCDYLQDTQKKINHHIQEEEGELFPQLKQHWNQTMCNRMAQEIRAMKEQEAPSR